MIYASICSGIEAASVAWEPLGWRPAWFAEIDKFPSAVLAHRFPNVPNIGDFTNAGKIPGDKIDLLVGGTPCQSFSVAGKRTGFDDDRGKLVAAYGDLVRRLRPRWIVWENVPGVVTGAANKSGFLRFVEDLNQCGYGVAWRILDAQYTRVDGFPRAVPQRRRRVFLVGCLGDWRAPAAVLFEPESVRGDDPPERRAGQNVACGTGGDRGTAYAIPGNVIGRQHGNGGNGVGVKLGVSYTLTAMDDHAVAHNAVVRRLTEVECERLQGFPDGWTDVPWRGGKAAKGHRYKALGNSMAVNCMRWIGQRIQQWEELQIE